MKAPHDKHYRKLKIQPLEVIEAWNLGFHLGNVVKYIARAKLKGQEKEDLEKALFYLKRYTVTRGREHEEE
jgi:hypothetical protein